MNPKDPLPPSTANLLRAPLPETEARPGLETRLLAGIRNAADRPAFPWRPVLGTSLAALILATVLFPLLKPSAPPSITEAPPAATRPVLEITELPNPLEKEAVALRSTATRAGRFLINCLPSVPDYEDQL